MNHSYLIDIVIDDLIEEYEKAKEYGYVINNPVSYALYQVWRKYDNQDIQYLRNQREDYESGLKKRKALNIYKTGIKGGNTNRDSYTKRGTKMSTKPYGEMICPLCGKPFVCHYTSTWKYRKYYKRKLYIMCSWRCLQALEKTAEEEKLKKQQEKEKKRKYGCNAPV